MRLILCALFVMGGMAMADETTCEVKGMHCTGCKEMIEGKVCDESKYSTCSVKIVDEKKEKGEIHLVTKDAKAKVDEKALSAMVKDAGYEMKACKSK
jgi:hypothetical protein